MSRTKALPGIGIAAAFLVIGLLTLEDFGVTWDELETILSGQQYWLGIHQWLETGDPPAAGPHIIPGYYFVLDTARAATSWLLHDQFGLVSEIEAYHLLNLVLASISVWAVWAIGCSLRANVYVASLGALALALTPRFIAHSQNNPKDLPTLFACTLVVLAAIKIGQSGSWRHVAWGSIALGFLFTTRVQSPALIAIPTLWLVIAERRAIFSHWRRYAVFLCGGVLAAFLFWPFLWPDPIGGALRVTELVRDYDLGARVLYLGVISLASDVPWHYAFVHLLTSTPVMFVLLAIAGALAINWRARPTTSLESRALLGLIWVAVPLALELASPARYDSMRHILVVLPGVALLTAAGIEVGWRWIGKLNAKRTNESRLRIAYVGLVGLGFVGLLVQLVSIHPYQSAYLNEFTNALLPGDASELFEVEYWGHAYLEGAEWIRANAPEDFEVLSPVGGPLLEHYFGSRSVPGTLPRFRDLSQPRYLMFITRRALYNRLIRGVERYYEPVFTIRRQNGTLLQIYSNASEWRQQRRAERRQRRQTERRQRRRADQPAR